MSREIDALVAEHIFDLPELEDHMLGRWTYIPADAKSGEKFPIPNYSTDIATAWEVVEKLDMTVGSTGEDWFARIVIDGHNGIRTTNYAPTAPMAICLAALKAKGIDL